MALADAERQTVCSRGSQAIPGGCESLKPRRSWLSTGWGWGWGDYVNGGQWRSRRWQKLRRVHGSQARWRAHRTAQGATKQDMHS